jgi:hypothetical protein
VTINTTQDVLKFLNHVVTCTKRVHLQNFDTLGINSCTIHALASVGRYDSYPVIPRIDVTDDHVKLFKFACSNLMQIAHIINAHLKIAGDK